MYSHTATYTFTFALHEFVFLFSKLFIQINSQIIFNSFHLLWHSQADNDHHVKDTYNYVTVQTDIRMPRRHFGVLADTARQAPWQAAIQAAVLHIEGEDKDCRVLNLGAGAGVLVTLNPDSAAVPKFAAII